MQYVAEGGRLPSAGFKGWQTHAPLTHHLPFNATTHVSSTSATGGAALDTRCDAFEPDVGNIEDRFGLSLL